MLRTPHESFSTRLDRIRNGEQSAVTRFPGKRADLFNAELAAVLKKHGDGIPEDKARELVSLYHRLFGE